jgi:hypothetical protein
MPVCGIAPAPLSRNITVNPQAVAEQLDALASRVRRVSPPLAGDPHRFHEERSDVAQAITELARARAPRRPRSQSQAIKVERSRRAG